MVLPTVRLVSMGTPSIVCRQRSSSAPLLGDEGAPLGDGRRMLLAAGELSEVRGLRLFAGEGGGNLSPSTSLTKSRIRTYADKCV